MAGLICGSEFIREEAGTFKVQAPAEKPIRE
jgi:hypothetical protein